MKKEKLPKNPVLVGFKRGKVWDTFISGAIAIVRNKKVYQKAGDIQFKSYLRSSEKPLQSVAAVLSGAADKFRLDDEEVAIIAGSHNGEPIHVEVVKRMLKKGGMDVSYLQCGIHAIVGFEAYKRYTLGFRPEPVCNNCSGKHAGMLLMCKHMGVTTDGYYKPEHPVQKFIKQVTADLCEYPVKKVETGVDGCGVPVHGMPLVNMAIAFENMANPEKAPEKYRSAITRVRSAIIAAPLMMGGHERLCTDINALPNKVVAKGGAEGMYCFGIVDRNVGVAMKMDSGKEEGWFVLAPQILNDFGVLSKDEYAGLYKDWIKPHPNCRKEEVAVTKIFFKAKKLGKK